MKFKLCAVLILSCIAVRNHAVGSEDPFDDLDHPGKQKAKSNDPFDDLDHPGSKDDPFADIDGNTKPKTTTPAKSTKKVEDDKDLFWHLFHDNFTYKKELYFQLSYSSEKAKTKDELIETIYARESVGYEILKKFTTETSTVAAFDMQGRMVRRDHFIESPNDPEGKNRNGWFFEFHNLYWDLYNIFNPFIDDKTRGDNVGRFNFRAGHFYLPFGLNLQTDTHGTLLQLSNDRNFGFERDWYAGLWGSINADVNYDVYYLLGSGSNIAFEGQHGMIGSRFSLSNKYRLEYGIEGGISLMSGQRSSKEGVERSPSVAVHAGADHIINTERYGLDWRYTRLVPSGSVAFSTELSAGHDDSDAVFTQLHQIDYLTVRRQWGLSTQYRRFWQDIGPGNMAAADFHTHKTDASIFGEFTWYFRNDIGNSNLHWIKVNVERQLERQMEKPGTIVTLQYYHYW